MIQKTWEPDCSILFHTTQKRKKRKKREREREREELCKEKKIRYERV
jgi:hypothetical protein